VKLRCWRRRERRSGGGHGKLGRTGDFCGAKMPPRWLVGLAERGPGFRPREEGGLSGRLFADTVESVFGADVQ
jgi:hypothetical protein